MVKKLLPTVLAVLTLLTIITPIATAAQKTTVPTTTNQFGSAPFDPNETISSNNGSLYVSEKGDYTYVYWQDVNDDFSISLYLSVAKKDKWIFRGKEVFKRTGLNLFYLSNNYVFYGSLSEGLGVLVVNPEKGEIISDKLLYKGELSPTQISQIHTKGKNGVLLSVADDSHMIYLEGELSSPLVINDKRKLIKNYLSTGKVILSEKRDRIIFYGFNSYVYDIKANDMIYDEEGEDREFKVGDPLSSMSFYVDGKFYSISRKSKPNTQLKIFDDNFKQIATKYYIGGANDIFFMNIVTIKNNSLRIWQYNDFKHTNSLKLTAIAL